MSKGTFALPVLYKEMAGIRVLLLKLNTWELDFLLLKEGGANMGRETGE